MLIFQGLFIALAIMTVYAVIENELTMRKKNRPMATRTRRK
jgi:hypothetical protein